MQATSEYPSVCSAVEEYGRLVRALQLGGRGRALPWAGIDLTLPQLKVLGLIASRPHGLHGRELAATLGVGPPAVTALVDRLAEPGYVRREEDPHDRRITWIRLTESGRLLLERMTAGQRERLAEVLDLLGPDELADVSRALRILREAGERWAASTSVTQPG